MVMQCKQSRKLEKDVMKFDITGDAFERKYGNKTCDVALGLVETNSAAICADGDHSGNLLHFSGYFGR